MEMTRRTALAAPAACAVLLSPAAFAAPSDAPTALDAILAELLTVEREMNRVYGIILAMPRPEHIEAEASLLPPLEAREWALMEQAVAASPEHPRDVAALVRIAGSLFSGGMALAPGASRFNPEAQNFNGWAGDLDGRVLRATYRAALAMA